MIYTHSGNRYVMQWPIRKNVYPFDCCHFLAKAFDFSNNKLLFTVQLFIDLVAIVVYIYRISILLFDQNRYKKERKRQRKNSISFSFYCKSFLTQTFTWRRAKVWQRNRKRYPNQTKKLAFWTYLRSFCFYRNKKKKKEKQEVERQQNNMSG